MCFRLFAALSHTGDGSLATALTESATREGLDVRAGVGATAAFVEIAWGDCACSLVTRKDGRERMVSWLSSLTGGDVQLLLFQDDNPPLLQGPVLECDWEVFKEQGLAALEEGQVTRIRWSGKKMSPPGAMSGSDSEFKVLS
jgi:hypothetical protein